MGNEIFVSMGISLVLTLILELGFCLAAKVRGAHDLLLVVLVNILTNPAVVVSYWLLVGNTNLPEAAIIIPLELSAVFVEGLCYKNCAANIKHPFWLSLGANAFSYLCGLLISTII